MPDQSYMHTRSRFLCLISLLFHMATPNQQKVKSQATKFSANSGCAIQLRIHCGSHTTIEVSSLPIGVVSLAFQGFQLCMQWTRLHNKSPRKQVRKWYSYGNTSTTHTHTHAHMHTHTHTHTHACMHTRARTRTHRHTSVHHVPLGGHTCTQIIN